jgi:4a-hydroxytetrahydrobiopterin dehydratase
MSDLAAKKCVPCEGDVTALTPIQAAESLKQVNPEWQIAEDGKKISRRFKFKTYKAAWDFVNKVSENAETENHHPVVKFGWGFAVISSTTHVIGGLSENDFILAAKIDRINH